MCSETDLTKEKVNFQANTGFPPLTAAALRIIICKRPAPYFDNHEKGMKNAFIGTLHNEIKCFLSVKE